MVSALPDNPQAQLPDLWARIEVRYRSCGRFARGYVRWKLRLDPILPVVLALARRERFGSVVDLGCGRGQLGVALLEAGLVERLTGLDWDERILAEARTAAGPRGTFLQADLRTATVPEADTALLIDILYLMPAEAQLGLLRRAAAAARERLIVRVFDPDRGWRSMVGWLSEGGIWLAGLYRRSQVRPLPLATVRATLEDAGFTTTVEPCWGVMPLPNVLIVARRR
jgi:SAM-dependent methyltransferase